MRYIPQSSYSFDEIAEQCKNAILRSSNESQNPTDVYAEVRKFYHYDKELVSR